MTDVRVTQVDLEQWLTTDPPAQITQVAIEQWASASASLSSFGLVTQVALEQWASVPPPASAAAQQYAVSVIT